MNPRRAIDPQGFTLLEILLALFIFAVVISVIFGAYIGTLKAKEETEFQVGFYQMARTVMELIREDLESACISEFTGEDDEVNGMDADTLSFKSRAHLVLAEDDQAAGTAGIAYYALEAEEDENSLILYRSDTPGSVDPPDPGTGGLEVCAGLGAVNFTYYDNDGDPHDSWDSSEKKAKEKLPKMVSIQLEFVNEKNPEAPLRFRVGVVLPMARDL
jgi:general secretion pathway protein J